MDSTLIKRTHALIAKIQKSSKTKALRACSQGDRLVGKDHRSSPTATHKDAQSKKTSCFKFVTQRLPYVHATGLTNLNTSISQIRNYSTSMTLISPSSYLKTIIKYQTSHSIKCTLYGSFYYTQLGCSSFQDQLYDHNKYHVVLKDSQKDISEA